MSKGTFKRRVVWRARKSVAAVRLVHTFRKWRTRVSSTRAARDSMDVLRRISPRAARFGPPRGAFSAYALLQRREVPGEVVLERQEISPIPPDAMRVASRLTQDGHQPWPIFWTEHADARLAGASLVLMDKEKHACLEAMYAHEYWRDPAFHSMRLPPPVELAGNWTSVVSRWTIWPNYYHWLTDALPRLALLDRLPEGTRIVVPGNLQPFQIETLRHMGVEEFCRVTPEPHLLLENYFFSAPTAMTGCTNPYAIRFLRDCFLPGEGGPFRGPDKIYVLRKGHSRGVLNDDDVMSFLSDRGWTPVDPQTLSFSQQVGLFAGARAVCGVHGSGLTNILWSPPGCTVIELMPDNHLNGCFESISACLDVQHRFLVLPGDRQFRIRVNLAQLRRILPD